MEESEETKSSQLVSRVWLENLVNPLDVINIKKTGETFRVLYDTQGKFVLRKIKQEEAKVNKTS